MWLLSVASGSGNARGASFPLGFGAGGEEIPQRADRAGTEVLRVGSPDYEEDVDMQAMHGFALLVRTRGRLIGCCTALALAIAAVAGASSASAVKLPIKQQYLAVGDSLAFGYSSQLYHEGEAEGFVDPEGFEHGYANQYFKPLQAKAGKEGSGLRLVNDGCPGETTASLIGTNATIIGTLNAALKKSQEENKLPPVKGESACAYQAAWNGFKKVGTGGPLHHPYSGSQLEDAIDTLYNAKVEKKPVTTISLNIGANDELKTLGPIEKEAKEFVEAKVAKVGKEAVEAKLAKVAAEAIEAKVNEQVYIKCSEKAFAETGGNEPEFEEARQNCLATEGKKLGEEYFAENQAKLEKEGKEAAEKYFAENKAQVEKEGKEAGEKYFAENKFKLGAEGEAFAGAKIEAAIPGLFAQINSNLAGVLLALRSGESLGLKGGKAINYTGRIIFDGGYDPFGKLFHFAFEGVQFVEENGGIFGRFGTGTGGTNIFGRCEIHGTTELEEKEKVEKGCAASEVHGGFNGLTDILNNAEKATTGSFGVCFANPRPLFNTGNQISEPEKLTLFTNMKNTTSSNSKFNGPDIHPTPLGYKEIGKLMAKQTNSTCKKAGLPGF
jgi:hypothetical protein